MGVPGDSHVPAVLQRCRATGEYQKQFSDPLSVRAGEELTLTGKEDLWEGQWTWVWGVSRTGKEGWLPQDYVERQGDRVLARYDYDATELSVATGDVLFVAKQASGWYWCRNTDGVWGWVPISKVSCS